MGKFNVLTAFVRVSHLNLQKPITKISHEYFQQ